MKNKNPWKRFIVIVTSLVIVIMVCVTTNMVINSIVGSIVPQGNSGLQVNVNTNGAGGNNMMQGGVNNGATYVPNDGSGSAVTDPQGGVVADPQGGAVVNPQGGTVNQQGGNTQSPVQGNGPLGYNKAQLVDYYNAALKKSYSYKMNVSKVENVTVEVGKVNIKAGINVDATKMANSIISNNTKKNGVVQTKSFVGGKSTDDGTSVQQFVLPTNLYADAVQDINITQNGQGYKMVIKLKSETCSHDGVAKYNASCSWPLDVGVIDFGQAVTIQECTFNYPGTILTAMIDAQGRVYAVQTDMPLHVSNAKATAVGATITVESIDGRWVCKNELKFL